RPCRILTLGDGNFSFSLALARALLLPARPPTPPRKLRERELPPLPPPRPRLATSFEIVATSFDGPLDLLTKYPESPGIVAALRSLGVTVQHNVDATALDSRVAEVAGPDGRRLHPQFDHVIFNHPHTGTEDMRRHRSFLGHFFHAVACPATTDGAGVAGEVSKSSGSIGGGGGGGGGVQGGGGKVDGGVLAASILAPRGAVHVTLALEQPERWGLEEQASRHGFSLVHRRRFPAEQIDGYMTKRHQTGRSFQQRVQDSETLSFAWAGDATTAPGEGAPSGEEGGAYTLPPWLWPQVSMCHGQPPPVRGSGHVAGAPPPSIDGDRSSVAASRGGDGKAAGAAATARAAAVPLPEACELCGKRYKTPQALRTHTRQFHELGQEGGVPLAAKKEEPCPHPDCGRVFTSERSLDQHVLAKHSGDNVDIKPDWFVGSIYHLEPPPPPPPPRPVERRHCSEDDDPEVGTTGNSAVASESDWRVGTTRKEQGKGQGAGGVPELSGLTSSPSVSSGRRDSGEFQQCDVCGFWFSCAEDARQHLDNLRPPIEGAVTYFDCGTCAKNFGSRRALLQHANFCGG
ncbi:unnamed protein product, partial [Hapterophycus canaliculatus]